MASNMQSLMVSGLLEQGFDWEKAYCGLFKSLQLVR